MAFYLDLHQFILHRNGLEHLKGVNNFEIVLGVPFKGRRRSGEKDSGVG